MGMSQEQARQWIDSQEPEAEPGQAAGGPCHVWPENWPALGLFLRLQTQWVRNPVSGERQALRYEAAEAAMNMMGVEQRAELFTHLVEMEHAALEAFDEL